MHPAPSTTAVHPAPDSRSVLARVVMPADARATPLYVDGARAGSPPVAEVLDRRRLRVPAGSRVSFATWFGAFPAGWWAAHTDVRQVRLDVRLTGPGQVEVFRSDAAGRVRQVDGPLLDLGGPDGGWLWFDVVAGEADVVVDGADWCAVAVEPGEPGEPGAVTVAVTTFDRPASALALLVALAGDRAVLDVVRQVVVVDQGTRRLRAEPGLASVEAALGGRLRLVEQPNLGGSGGFSRGMLTALDAGSRYVLLLDDDIVLEPEALRRAVAFADRCRRPTLVSGAMLDLTAPTVLHTPGERLDRGRFLWETVPPGEEDHDLAGSGLRVTPWLHRRLDVEFGAWWFCLVPTRVLREVGLALPLFLKWDDIEHGVRAGAAGFPTVALPGVSVWHEPWTAKADTLGWQAYFHVRNRVVAALLHSPRRRPVRLLADSFEHTLRQLVALRPAVTALHLAALRDVLRGPGDLHASLATRLGEVRALGGGFPDGRPVADPPAAESAVPAVRPPASRPAEVVRLAVEVLRAAWRSDRPAPVVHVASDDAAWWRLARLDGAVVATPPGTRFAHRRDRATARSQLRRTVALHARLVVGWPRLRAAYRQAAPDLVSPATWRRTTGAEA